MDKSKIVPEIHRYMVCDLQAPMMLRSTGYTGVIAHNATHLELEHVSEDHMIIFESRRLQVTISEQIQYIVHILYALLYCIITDDILIFRLV